MSDFFSSVGASPDVGVLRRLELRRLQALFETHSSPRLVLLTGDVGLGKTSLRDYAFDSARKEGWQVLPGEGPELRVDLSTTVRSFVRRLAELLGSNTMDVSNPDVTDEADAVTAQVERVIEELTAARGPVILALSDYRPGRAFKEWFEQAFVPKVLAGERPMLLILEGSKARLASLHASAHLIINLGLAPAEPIQDHFGKVAPLLSPPVGSDELSLYVEECRRKPALMEGLTRILLLVASPKIPVT